MIEVTCLCPSSKKDWGYIGFIMRFKNKTVMDESTYDINTYRELKRAN